MTQDNILVSPTLSACLKPGVQSLRSRHSVSGDTLDLNTVGTRSTRVPKLQAPPASFPSFPSVKAFGRFAVNKIASLISNNLGELVYIKTHRKCVFMVSNVSTPRVAIAIVFDIGQQNRG